MNIEEGVICEINGDKAKVKIGKSRIREVKMNKNDNFREGDIVKIMMGLIVCKA